MDYSFQVLQAVLCMHSRYHVRGNYAPCSFPNNSTTLITTRHIILSENCSWYFPCVIPQRKWSIGGVRYSDTLKKPKGSSNGCNSKKRNDQVVDKVYKM